MTRQRPRRERRPRPQPEREQQVWRDKPSPWCVFLTKEGCSCILFCWLIFPLFYLIWEWIKVRNTTYYLTTQRLRIQQGVFNKNPYEIELKRVRGQKPDKPFFYRFFNLGIITLKTNDQFASKIILDGIRNPDEVNERIRTWVKIETDKPGGLRD